MRTRWIAASLALLSASSAGWAQSAGMIDPKHHQGAGVINPSQHRPAGIADASRLGGVQFQSPVFSAAPASPHQGPAAWSSVVVTPYASGYVSPWEAGIQVASSQAQWAGLIGAAYGLTPAQYGWVSAPCDWRNYRMLVISAGSIGPGYGLEISRLAWSGGRDRGLILSLGRSAWTGSVPLGWNAGPFVCVPWPLGWDLPSVHFGLSSGCPPPRVWGPVQGAGYVMYPGRMGVWRATPSGLEPIYLPPARDRD